MTRRQARSRLSWRPPVSPRSLCWTSPDRASTPEGLWLTAKEQEAWRTFLYATTLLYDRFGDALQSDPEIDLALGSTRSWCA